MPKIKVNDINIYYESTGDGEPLILISGFSADHNAWMGVKDALAKHYQVITFDNRGVGQSDCPDYPYTVEMMAEDTVALCRALGIKQAHFVGSSMGGRIAQSIAYQYPAMTRSMTLVNSMSYIHPLWQIIAEGLLELYQTNVSFETRSKLAIPWVFSRHFLDESGKLESLIELNKANPYPTTEMGYRHQYEAMIAFDSRPFLKDIQAPTLVISGDEDIIAPRYQSDELIEKIPHVESYCFKQTSHLPHIEKPTEFIEVLLGFLQKQEN